MGRHVGSTLQRTTGLTKSAGWEVGAQRTYRVSPQTLWEFLTSAEGLQIWLGDIAKLPLPGESFVTATGTRGEVRSVRPLDRVRVTWQPPDRDAPAVLQFALIPTATGTAVRFHQEKLASAEDRAVRRAALEDVLDRIDAALSARKPSPNFGSLSEVSA